MAKTTMIAVAADAGMEEESPRDLLERSWNMKPFRSRLNGTKQPVNGEWRPAKTSVKLISILSDVRVSVYGRVSKASHRQGSSQALGAGWPASRSDIRATHRHAHFCSDEQPGVKILNEIVVS
jgi:hypothetical protein